MIKFTEDAKADFLEGTNLINFSKRSMVAEIIAEIQRYQNQPYCLSVYPELREFLEKLDPFPDMDQTEIDNYLWTRSSDIETNCPDGGSHQNRKKPKEAERRWKNLDLRSPGIKHKNPPSHFSPFNPAFVRSGHHHERAHSSSGSQAGGSGSHAGGGGGISGACGGNESDSPATSPPHRGGMS